jgi:hypothetical protein
VQTNNVRPGVGSLDDGGEAMKMNVTRGQVGLLSTTVALAVLVGCQPPATVNTQGENSVSRGTGGTATVPNAQTAQPEQKSPTTPTVTENEPEIPAPTVDAEGLAPVDLAKPMFVKASEGGKFVSEDGLLTAIIPPGALSQDTQIRFVRLDTSKAKNTNQHLNGIRFQMDLGDAYVLPGQKLNVAAKADDRLIPELQSMYDDYTPERYALSQDEKGNWVVTMAVSGPADKPLDMSKAPNDPYLTERRGIMTEGFAPIPAGKGGNFKKDSRIEAFCDYYPPPPPKPMHQIWADCKWESDDPALDGLAAYDANSRYNTYVRFGNATTASVSGVNGYWTKEFVPGAPAEAEVSHWEEVTDTTSNGVKTSSGKTFTFAELGISAADFAEHKEAFFPTASNDNAAQLSLMAISAAELDAAKADLASDRVQVDSAGKLQVKVIDKAAKPAVADSYADKFIAGWIDLTTGTNETVRTGYEWNGWCHCSWTVHRDKIVEDLNPQPVQPNGKASNWARETFTISAQGYTNEPNPTPGKYPGAGVGSTATRTITSGTNEVSIVVPKYSPMFGATLVSPDKKMEGDFTIVLNISGVGDRTYTFQGNGGNSMALNFRVRMPDNEVHQMSLKEVHFADNSLVGKSTSYDAIKNLNVQRNGVYDGFTVDIVPAGAK